MFAFVVAAVAVVVAGVVAVVTVAIGCWLLVGCWWLVVVVGRCSLVVICIYYDSSM